jgi:hypothetical protein
LRVALIDQGQWGYARRDAGDYEIWNELLKEHLGGAGHTVSVFPDTEEARGWLENKGAMVFTTRGMIGHAVELAARHPAIRITVLVGSFPGFNVPIEVVDKSELALKPEEVLRTIVGV